MPRLPRPGGDSGNWGDILNEYLSVSLSEDGSIRSTAISKNSLGLENVDNTNDLDKPLSVAAQSALDNKLSLNGGTLSGATVITTTDESQRALDISFTSAYAGVNPRGLFVAPTYTGTASGAAAAAFAPTIQNSQNVTSAYGFINNLLSEPQAGANVINAMAGYQWLRTGSGGGTIANAYGMRVASAQIGSTVPTNLYGISVDTQTGGANNYGIAIAEAGTASLYLTSSSGLSAGGIRFGSDTTLYRSASATLTTNGKLSADAAAATHSLTLGSTGNGMALYLSADQTANYERGRLYWNAGTLTLSTENSGSGVARSLALVAQGKYFNITGNGINMGQGAVAASNFTLVSMTTNYQATTGLQTLLSVTPTITQSGSAGYVGLKVNVTETSIGSGARNLIDIQSNDTSRFKVDANGNSTVSGSLQYGATLRQGYASRTSDTSLSAGNASMNFCDASSAAITITLNSLVENGTTFTIKKIDASANVVTLAPNSGMIDDASSYLLTAQHKYVTVVAYNSNWQIVANN